MKTHTTRICLALVAVLSTGGFGCALPVIEGVFDSRDFAIFDETPEARGQARDEVLLVFLELEGEERLRTVSVDLRDLSTLPVGEALDVGDGSFGDQRPNVEVVEGSVVRDQLDDGGVLISTGDDATRAMSMGGSVTLDENDNGAVAGTFRVDLDDGGYLEGRFASAQ